MVRFEGGWRRQFVANPLDSGTESVILGDSFLVNPLDFTGSKLLCREFHTALGNEHIYLCRYRGLVRIRKVLLYRLNQCNDDLKYSKKQNHWS